MSQWTQTNCPVPVTACQTPAVDPCTLLGQILAAVNGFWGNFIGMFNQIFCVATPVYVRETRPVQLGSGNRVTVLAAAALQMTANSYRKITIREQPGGNAGDIAVIIGGNTITLEPGDDDLVFDFPEWWVTTPNVTVTVTGADEADVDFVQWSVA